MFRKIGNKVWEPALWIALVGMIIAGIFMPNIIVCIILAATAVAIIAVITLTDVGFHLLTLSEREEFEEERNRQRAKGLTLTAGFEAQRIVRERRLKAGKRCWWV